MAEKKSATKVTKRSAKSAPARRTTSKAFTAEESAAMKARAKEVKAEARASKNRAEGSATCSRRSPR